jgi:phage shock protein PspC (stress-responsive transcriptional regulator)
MTTTGTTTPTEPSSPEPASPDLERPTLHPYRGVCSALARTTGTDVLLWRVLFIVLAFFDGLGILLYLVGLLTIPREGEPHSVAERLLRGPNRRLRRDEILLVVLTVIVGGNMIDHGNNLVALAVIAAVALLFLHGRPDRPVEPVGTPPLVRPNIPLPMDPLPSSVTVKVAGPPRPNSALGPLTLGLAAVVAGFLVLLNTAGSAGIEPEAIIASALAVVGAGLVVGAWWGRSSLLVLTAILLALALGATNVGRPVVEAGVGDRTWTPHGAADYRLGVGDATLDLRNMVIGDGVPVVKARVDVGELTVIVPSAVRVTVDMHAEVGELSVSGLGLNGTLVERLQDRGVDLGTNDLSGHDVDREITIGPAGPTQIQVDASVRFGQITVIRRG